MQNIKLNPKFLADRAAAIAQSRRDGRTYREIAEAYGLSRERVRQIIEQQNHIDRRNIDRMTRSYCIKGSNDRGAMS